MLSVLIVHAAPEPALAVTLSRLVEAALDTLLSDVTLLDLCDDPHAARLAEEGGCALRRHDDPAAGDLRAMAAQARRNWVLLAASGLALAPGWSQIARETLAMAQAEAPRVGSRLSGALFETPPRGALRRFVGGPEGVTLVRRDALALAPLRPASLARDAAAAARRAGRLRRIPGFCVDERV
jgi:hypothetical protein